MDEIKKWIEERARLWEQAKKLNDAAGAENRDFSAEEQQTWDKLQEGINSLDARIKRAEFLEEAEGRQASEDAEGRGQRVPADRIGEGAGGRIVTARSMDWVDAFQGWALRGVGKHNMITDVHAEACRRCGVEMSDNVFEAPLPMDYGEVRAALIPELRAALDTQTATEGAEFTYTEIVRRLEEALITYQPVRRLAQVIRTTHGNPQDYPTMDDTSNSGSEVDEEASAAVETAVDPTTGKVTLTPIKYKSGSVIISAELIQDNAVNFVAIVLRMLSERIARILNTRYATGNGTTQPEGFITGGTSGASHSIAGDGATMDADKIIDLFYAIPAPYRDDPAFAFMANDANIARLRKVKDSQGQYLWQPALVARTPDRVLGYPIYPNSAMDSTFAAGSEPIVAGAWSKYLIRDVSEIRFRRLVELKADTDQEVFCAFFRSDGKVLDAGTHPIQYLSVVA